jgi:hypothetical protein
VVNFQADTQQAGLEPQLGQLLYAGMEDSQAGGLYGGLKMIVVEFIEGQTAHELFDTSALRESRDVKKAIEMLHARG